MNGPFIRLMLIIVAAEVSAILMATGFENAGFNPMRAWAAAFFGINFAFLAAGMIVADHEARGRGK